MKKRKAAVLAAAILLALTLSLFGCAIFSGGDNRQLPPGDDPVSYYGDLKVSHGKITGANTGRQVQLAGMSFFWSNWGGHYYKAEYVHQMVDEFGCEVLRVPYGVNDNGIPYRISDDALVGKVVDAAIDEGIYVIIDWHSHGAHKSPDSAVRFFSAMAEKYGGYDNVIFEIYNEPLDISWSEVKSYAETVIAAIREYSDNLVIVGTTNWSQDVEVAAADPVDDENTAYTLHFYAGSHRDFLRQKADKALKKDLALFVTEWGPVNADGNGPVNYTSSCEWLNWLNENGISYCGWSINSKDEGASIFTSSDELTKTGLFYRQVINDRTAQSEWRSGKPYKFSEVSYTPEDIADAA